MSLFCWDRVLVSLGDWYLAFQNSTMVTSLTVKKEMFTLVNKTTRPPSYVVHKSACDKMPYSRRTETSKCLTEKAYKLATWWFINTLPILFKALLHEQKD
jgi:hypothetical protein